MSGASYDSQLQLAAVRARVLGSAREPVRIGRFRLLERIGAGGMGVVYAAHDDQLDRRIAIKLVHGSLQDDARRRRRALLEARSLARLSHPNVVQVHEIGEHDGKLFVAMEFIEGPTLRDWLGERRRRVAEIIDMYLQAGRGLCAAHAVGIVHLDFKPDNVMIGRDRRVRVLDFGLARSESEIRASTRAVELAGEVSVSESSVGALAGTPAYMSPEQLLGHAADARSDQFSFALSLYEALYGERPFRGVSIDELRERVLSGQLEEPRGGVRVPRRIDRILRRALRVNAAERHPSLKDMLMSIERGRARRRWIATGGIAAGGVALSVVLTLTATAREDPCRGAADRVAEIWGQEQQRVIEGTFAATGLPYADATWATVRARIERYLGAWRESFVDACSATLVRGEQSPALMDRRMRCLDERMEDVHALVDLLERADWSVVERSVDAVDALRSIEHCSDSDALSRELPPPDGARAEAVAVAQRELATLSTLDAAGKLHTAGAWVDGTIVRARQTEYPPLVAEAEFLHARFALVSGAVDVGVERLLDALRQARAARYQELVARASIELIEVVGERQGKLDQGLLLARLVDAGLAGGGFDSRLWCAWEFRHARLLWATGAHVDAIAAYREIIARYVEAGWAPDATLASARLSLGQALWMQDDFGAAERELTLGLGLHERIYGALHPSYARALTEVGAWHALRGETERATQLFEQALEILVESEGPDGIDAAKLTMNLGAMSFARGDDATGRRRFEEALRIVEARRGPTHLTLTMFLENTAAALVDKDRERSIELLRRSLKIHESVEGREHPEVARALIPLGDLLRMRGQLEESRAHLERAIELRDKDDTHILLRARARLGLARTLWALGPEHRARAVELAKRAVRDYEVSDARLEFELPSAQNWLEEHQL